MVNVTFLESSSLIEPLMKREPDFVTLNGSTLHEIVVGMPVAVKLVWVLVAPVYVSSPIQLACMLCNPT